MANDWATRFEGLGAWWAGKGPTWEQAQADLLLANQKTELERQKRLQELDKERKAALLTDFSNTYWYLKDKNVPMAMKLLDNRIAAGDSLGADMYHTAGLRDMIKSGDIQGAQNELELFLKSGGISTTDKLSNFQTRADGSIWGWNERRQQWDPTNVQPGSTMPGPKMTAETAAPADVRTFEYYNNLSPADQKRFLEMKRAQQLIDLGGGAQGVVGGTTVTPVTQGPGQTLAGARQEYAGAEANLASAKETGKLAAQLKLLPEVKSAVESAVSLVKTEAAKTEEARTNSRALATYDAAMSGLASAMGQTTTGPGMGWLPAVTANQQIADGAVAAMAPVLKSIFRVAGEGTFTDKDQQLLLQMVPTRNDLPDARVAKIQMIDAIVRAKLGSGGSASPAQQAPSAGGGQVKFMGFVGNGSR